MNRSLFEPNNTGCIPDIGYERKHREYYTRLGRIEEPASLAEALGSGSVYVIFEIKK